MKLSGSDFRIFAAGLLAAVLLQLFMGVPVVAGIPAFSGVRPARPPVSFHSGDLHPAIPPEPEPEPPPEGLRFSGAEVPLVSILYECAVRPDTGALLQEPLDWSLYAHTPTVLIVHSHGTESFAGQEALWSSDYRARDTAANMVAVGDALAVYLENAGIRVLHDRTMHDMVSYNGAYTSSRRAVESYLQQYPGIRLVLDLHRDAAWNADGSPFAPVVEGPEGRTARLLLVMGTGYKNWQENLALGVKLQALLEKNTPGLTRGTVLRTARYNQDLSPGSVLVEFGAAGNTLEEVLRAVPLLGEAILALAEGAN